MFNNMNLHKTKHLMPELNSLIFNVAHKCISDIDCFGSKTKRKEETKE